MYITVTWRHFADTATAAEIEGSVHRALGPYLRCELWPGVTLVAARSVAQVDDIVADLDAVEATYTTLFSFAVLTHADGNPFFTSETYDVETARKVARV